MSFSFTRTREQLRDMVLGKLGVLASGGTANSSDATLVYEAIDLRLKEMHRLGTYWRNVPAPFSFSVTASTTVCSATADILFPIVLTVVENGRDIPVDIIGKEAYAQIESKEEAGFPLKALWNGSAGFTLWPVPISSGTAKLTYEQIADDTAASTAPDVDVAMLRWMKDIIAYDLGDHFGKSEGTMQRWMKEAETAEKNIRKLNAEHVTLTPVAVDDYDYSPTATKRDWNTG